MFDLTIDLGVRMTLNRAICKQPCRFKIAFNLPSLAASNFLASNFFYYVFLMVTKRDFVFSFSNAVLLATHMRRVGEGPEGACL